MCYTGQKIGQPRSMLLSLILHRIASTMDYSSGRPGRLLACLTPNMSTIRWPARFPSISRTLARNSTKIGAGLLLTDNQDKFFRTIDKIIFISDTTFFLFSMKIINT